MDLLSGAGYQKDKFSTGGEKNFGAAPGVKLGEL
jgi:hypothetical protein